mmetsp:Transcript_24615/g.38245  ORF Transcript_24615/g.38245 Transcript_24615/m.38245 type:complete len:110 (+) Transcript_24615:5646-5975(+)
MRAATTAGGAELSSFEAYPSKAEKTKIKLILKANDHPLPRLQLLTKDLDTDDLQNTLNSINEAELQCVALYKFDYYVRKAVKICIKDTTENCNEETIDIIWFYVLDSLL